MNTNAKTPDPRLADWQKVRLILFAALNTKRTRAELILGDERYDFWEHEGAILLGPCGRTFGADFVLRTDGTLYPTKLVRREPREKREKLWSALLSLREEPFHFITRQGRETGTCAMCGRELTDPESIKRGIGPVCGGRIDKILTPKRNQRDEATLDFFR